MAKKSLKVKQQKPQKYQTREYNRCKICGRPHAYIRKFGICRVCFRELAHKGEIPGVKKQAGKEADKNKKKEGKKLNITDPIADMLTRIRNANSSKHKTVDVPASNMKKAIADILVREGYIKSSEVIEDGTQGIIRITLKYDEKGARVIDGLKRISKPGLRVYASKDELPRVLNGLGIALISTSKGIKTDKEAREEGLGGEVLAYVW